MIHVADIFAGAVFGNGAVAAGFREGSGLGV